MTNKEKFKEVFGLEIDDSADCGFFDCSDKLCKDCPVKETKSWWNTEYISPQSGTWVTMTYDAYVDLLSQTVKALEQEPAIDKIRAEIMNETESIWNTEIIVGMKRAVDIIDNYKAESEE